MIRWTPRKKAELLTLIDADPVKGDKLIKLYDLSPEELIEWRKALSIELKALRATKLHYYNPKRAKKPPYRTHQPKPKV